MPRAKTSKKYKKLMSQFVMGWNFREPYQLLLDADFVITATDCKMDMVRMLADIVHGQVKPMITQCSMRHLYARKSESAIELAKTFERRRCGHHPDEYPEPLSTHDCLMSVVDPKSQRVNKFKYCCAINDENVRASLRRIPGVPLIYIRRSVMVMEPMAAATANARSKEERLKFRAELMTTGDKRKRDEDDTDEEGKKEPAGQAAKATKSEKKKKRSGPKGPNPLSVKKRKPQSTLETSSRPDKSKAEETEEANEMKKSQDNATTGDAGSGEAPKKKRRRKHKSQNVDTASASVNPSHEAQGLEAEA